LGEYLGEVSGKAVVHVKKITYWREAIQIDACYKIPTQLIFAKLRCMAQAAK